MINKNTFNDDTAVFKYNLPTKLVNEIITLAKKCSINKIILFGSRAKGTNSQRSDVDIAISGGNFSDFYWLLKDNTHTLLTFDIVDIDSGVSNELLTEIKRDGVIIYEKTK